MYSYELAEKVRLITNNVYCLLVFNTVQFPDMAAFQAVQRQLTTISQGYQSYDWLYRDKC